MVTTIGLIDDHGITRKGIKTLLESTHKYKIILEASNGKDVFKQLQKEKLIPELMILDLSMPDMDGYTILDNLSKNYPSIKILVFSFYHAEDAILNAINKGAVGYVLKSEDPEILLTAIQSILRVGFFFNDQVKKKYTPQSPVKNGKGFHGKQVLTEREILFIRLASSNLSYKEIAAQMMVQPKTLENYRDSVFQKLGINNRAALVLYGIQNGIVPII